MIKFLEPVARRVSRLSSLGLGRKLSAIFLEAGVSLLFFGAFRSDVAFQKSAHQAVKELQSRGFQFGTSIRIYSLESEASVQTSHAALWSPGAISVRRNSTSGEEPIALLRHELMHEAIHHTCSESPFKQPTLWANEATAIAFSGVRGSSAPLNERDMENLKSQVKSGAQLDTASFRALTTLVTEHGWPTAPCASSKEIREILESGPRLSSAPLSYILISLLSGRVLERDGPQRERYPPGSLLKIPYAAQLSGEVSAQVSDELVKSDGEALLERFGASNKTDFDFIYARSGFPSLPTYPGTREAWRIFLGERASDQTFPISFSMPELATLMRSALLVKPELVEALSENGNIPDSTLFHASSAAKKSLHALRVSAKTGTISTHQGEPLVGHLMLAFPIENPRYLSIFRRGGVRGAQVLEAAAPIVRRWEGERLLSRSEVRVSLLPLADASQIKIRSRCPFREREIEATIQYDSHCGHFEIETSLQGALPKRTVWGRLERSARSLVLVTDPESYADGVLEAEADTLQGAAREALRAVVAWNGIHGADRHHDDHALCDMTHCQVYRGVREQTSERVPVQLFNELDKLAVEHHEAWLPFSAGGLEPWTRQFSLLQAQDILQEASVLSVQRERLRSGDVEFHFIYPTSQETVSCEVVRKSFGLPSCPDSVRLGSDTLQFSGQGRGHGVGVSVASAEQLAREGKGAIEILRKEYMGIR